MTPLWSMTLDVFHDEEGDTVLLTDVIESADVRMVQLRNRLGLALEPGLELRTFGEVLGKNFDSDGALEAGVFGFVDFTDAPRTNRREDLVGTKADSDVQRHTSWQF